MLVRNRIRQDVLVVQGSGGLSGVEGAQTLELVRAGVDYPRDVLLITIEASQVGGIDAKLTLRHDQLGDATRSGAARVRHIGHVHQDELNWRRVGQRNLGQQRHADHDTDNRYGDPLSESDRSHRSLACASRKVPFRGRNVCRPRTSDAARKQRGDGREERCQTLHVGSLRRLWRAAWSAAAPAASSQPRCGSG